MSEKAAAQAENERLAAQIVNLHRHRTDTAASQTGVNTGADANYDISSVHVEGTESAEVTEIMEVAVSVDGSTDDKQRMQAREEISTTDSVARKQPYTPEQREVMAAEAREMIEKAMAQQQQQQQQQQQRSAENVVLSMEVRLSQGPVQFKLYAGENVKEKVLAFCHDHLESSNSACQHLYNAVLAKVSPASMSE